MERKQVCAEHLIGADEVREVRLGVVLADVAIAGFVGFAEVAYKFGIPQVRTPRAGMGTLIHRAGTRQARRRYAVEGITAKRDPLANIFWLTDAEEVARLIFRERLIDNAECLTKVVFTETTADAVAIKIHVPERLRALAAQIEVPAALHYAVETLILKSIVIVFVGEYRTLGPTMGTLHGLFLVVIVRGRTRTLIEGDDDVSADGVLDLDRALSSEPMQ